MSDIPLWCQGVADLNLVYIQISLEKILQTDKPLGKVTQLRIQKRLISVYPKDLPALDSLLFAKLSLFDYHPHIDARSKVSREINVSGTSCNSLTIKIYAGRLGDNLPARQGTNH